MSKHSREGIIASANEDMFSSLFVFNNFAQNLSNGFAGNFQGMMA